MALGQERGKKHIRMATKNDLVVQRKLFARKGHFYFLDHSLLLLDADFDPNEHALPSELLARSQFPKNGTSDEATMNQSHF